MVMLEAITKKEELETYCSTFKRLGVPILYGMVQGSHSYKVTPHEGKKLGIKVMIFAAACLLPTYIGVTRALESLKEGQRRSATRRSRL